MKINIQKLITAAGAALRREVKQMQKQIVCVPTSCYTDTIEKEGGVTMAGNAERVANYHNQLTNIRVRFPSPEACGEDYAKMIRDRARELGFIVEKGKDKGEGSANAYILHLIEQDLGIQMIKGMNQIEK